MRSLLLIGAIAVFIGCALTVPNGASVSARIIENTNTIDLSGVKTFFSGNPVSSVQLLRAGAVLDNAARIPAVQTAMKTVDTSKKVIETISAVDPFSEGSFVTPSSAIQTIGSVAKTVTTALSQDQPTDALAAAIATSDQHQKDLLQKISWARDKGDVRLCSDALVVARELKVGDVLALCLALVNHESDRCVQISDQPLQDLCQSALAPQAIPLSDLF